MLPVSSSASGVLLVGLEIRGSLLFLADGTGDRESTGGDGGDASDDGGAGDGGGN